MYKKIFISNNLIIRILGLQYYKKIIKLMQNFTNTRDKTTIDEIWLLEHYSIFTKGKTSIKEKILLNNNIPIVNTNRGGKITYHAPGQQIIYILLDLKRKKLTISKLIKLLEYMIISILKDLSIKSHTIKNCHGVFVNNKKICSIGLYIKNGYSYHGISLNVSMDLSPFKLINPCGLINIKMVQVNDFKKNININNILPIIIINCIKYLNFC